MSILEKNAALSALCEKHLPRLAQEEGLEPAAILEALEAGTMVLLGNPAHSGLEPLLVGQPSRVKVNANLGTSPLLDCRGTERRKIARAQAAGASPASWETKMSAGPRPVSARRSSPSR